MEENGIVQGAEEQEVTEPATTTTEPVNPTEGANEAVSATEPATEGTTEPNADKKTEEDSRFASVRRKAEAEARARYESQSQRTNDRIRQLCGDYVNPVTGKPIETFEEYLDALEAQQKSAREEELRSKGVDPKMIENMVNNSPVIKKAEQVLQQSAQMEAQRQFEADLKDLGKIDPSIKTEEDLIKHPSYPKVYELVSKNGLTLQDAYRLANYDTLSAKNSAAVKQASLNQAKAKNHLEATGSGMASNDSLVDVPASLASTWKSMNPGISDSEIKKKYNELLKNTGGK